MTEPPNSRGAGRRWLRVVVLAGILLIAAVVALWHGPGSAFAGGIGAFEIERRADGSWQESPSLRDRGFSVSLWIGSTKASTRTTTTGSTIADEGQRLAARSLLVASRGGDALTDGVARRVIEALREDPFLERLAYAPAGAANAPGGRRPDVFVTLELLEHRDHTFVGQGGVQVRMQVNLADEPVHPRGTHDAARYSPRAIAYGACFDFETTFAHVGIATPNVRFANTADELARNVVSAVRNHLGELRKQYGDRPRLPAAFEPEFRPVDTASLPLADIDQLELLGSWRGVFLHNETWWRGVVDDESAAFERIAAQLRAAGYEKEGSDGAPDMTYRAGTRSIRVFVHRPLQRLEDPVILPLRSTGSVPVFVCCRERFSTERLDAAIDASLADDAPFELLALFATAWNEPQRERGLARMQSTEFYRADHLLLCARVRVRQGGDAAGAAKDLQRAVWLANTGFGADSTARDVEQAAEALGVEIKERNATPAALLAAGFLQLAPGEASVEHEVTEARPLRCFVQGDEHPVLLAVGLERTADGALCGALRRVEGSGTSSLGGLGAGVIEEVTRTGRTVRVELLDAPADGAVRVRMSIVR